MSDAVGHRGCSQSEDHLPHSGKPYGTAGEKCDGCTDEEKSGCTEGDAQQDRTRTGEKKRVTPE